MSSTSKLKRLAQTARPPVAVSLLVFAPSTICNTRGEKTKSHFQTEHTSVLPLSDCVVCAAVTAHSTPRHLEAMIERVGGL